MDVAVLGLIWGGGTNYQAYFGSRVDRSLLVGDVRSIKESRFQGALWPERSNNYPSTVIEDSTNKKMGIAIWSADCVKEFSLYRLRGFRWCCPSVHFSPIQCSHFPVLNHHAVILLAPCIFEIGRAHV